MGSVERFEDLDVWKMSRELVNKIYSITRKKDFSTDFGLKNQIRRSSVSVMNNISEGFEGRTVNRFIEYLGISKGSCGETRSMLYVALDCEYINKEEFDDIYNLTLSISRKIRKFMTYLENYESNNRIKDVMVKYQV